MTDILLVCDEEGCFRACEAHGHASFAPKGRDIVCASETLVLRTAMKILENTKGCVLNANVASRGNLAFSVEVSKSPENTERLKCTADFIRSAIKSLQEEFPEHVKLREKSED